MVPSHGQNRTAAYIDRELHRKITAIVSVGGTREVTVGSYIDNVLREHFQEFGTDVIRYCRTTVEKLL